MNKSPLDVLMAITEGLFASILSAASETGSVYLTPEVIKIIQMYDDMARDSIKEAKKGKV